MLEGFQRKIDNINNDIITAEQCFDALTEEEKTELLNNKREIEFAAGETIIKEGFVASHILFIEDGLAKLDVKIDNKTSTVSLVPPKSFIGIMCTFAGHNLEFSSIAIAKTNISLIDIDLFEKFIRNNGDFAFKVTRHISYLTNRMVHQIARFSHKNIDGSLSILLLDFSKIYNSDKFTLPLKRTELAQMLGYSKESVINTLSRFNKEKIIEVNDKKIVILDKQKLMKIGITG